MPVDDRGRYLCVYCGKITKDHSNYCDWDCHVKMAKDAGGIVHTPNNLPITCIRFDGLMIECEHGDHPDYKFPVTIERPGYKPPPREEQDPVVSEFEGSSEWHALIYTDGTVALTMYKCCYALWWLRDGRWLGGDLWDKTYALSENDRTKILERFPRRELFAPQRSDEDQDDNRQNGDA